MPWLQQAQWGIVICLLRGRRDLLGAGRAPATGWDWRLGPCHTASLCPQVLPSKSCSSSPKEMVLFFTWYAQGSLGPGSRSEHQPPPLLTFKPSTGPDDFVFKHDPNLLPSCILITTTLVQACWRPHSSILRASLTPTCNPTPILRVHA